MAEIAMCRGDGCPLKDMCYRHTAEKDPYRQMYYTKTPYENGKCKQYWNNGAGRPSEALPSK